MHCCGNLINVSANPRYDFLLYLYAHMGNIHLCKHNMKLYEYKYSLIHQMTSDFKNLNKS